MRFSSLALAAALLVVASGCDSTGLDSSTPGCTVGCTPGGGTPGGGNPGGGNSGGGNTGGGNTGGGNTGGGGTTTPPQASTFARVDPTATYLRAEDGTPFATAYALDQYGFKPGDTACFKAIGDYTVYPGMLASATGNPLATGVFSASQTLSAPSERNRVKDAIDGNWDLNTKPLYSTGALTEIDEDFEATDDCWTVPEGATYVFFSVYDDSYFDNADVDGNKPFGIQITRR